MQLSQEEMTVKSMEQQYLHHMEIQHADWSITQKDKLSYPLPSKIYRHNTALKYPKGKYLTYVSGDSYKSKLLKLLLKAHTNKEAWLSLLQPLASLKLSRKWQR